MRKRMIGLGSLALAFVVAARPACAQIGSDRYAALIETASDGHVMMAANADELRHPASLAKLMTLYLTFEALRDRRIVFDELVPVSAGRGGAVAIEIGAAAGDADHGPPGDPVAGDEIGQ